MKRRNKGLRRSISSEQLHLRMLNVSIDGTVATPIASSFDQHQIASIIDLGAGNYTIIFASPFERDCLPQGHMMLAADRAMHVTAVAFDRVTVQCSDLAGVAADAAFNLSVMGSDGRFDY